MEVDPTATADGARRYRRIYRVRRRLGISSRAIHLALKDLKALHQQMEQLLSRCQPNSSRSARICPAIEEPAPVEE